MLKFTVFVDKRDVMAAKFTSSFTVLLHDRRNVEVYRGTPRSSQAILATRDQTRSPSMFYNVLNKPIIFPCYKVC